MIHLQWIDPLDGVVITELDMGSVPRGSASVPVMVLLKCTGVSVPNLLITATYTPGDGGSEIDTAGCTRLSLDGVSWFRELRVGLVTNETIPVYIEWNPPSNAPSGDVAWDLGAVVSVEGVTSICTT